VEPIARPATTYTEVDCTSGSNLGNSLARVQPTIGTCLHTTSGTNSRAILQGLAGSTVSVHTLIERTGTRNILYTPDRVTYHVGASIWNVHNFRACDYANEILLGIELECLDAQEPTWQQLDSAAEQVVLWAAQLGWRWPYTIFGHYGIAVPLGRRSDPYRLNWGSFMGFLYARSKQHAIGGLE
jgi:N-acetyl-anhydromuramyl-L-alanine amidase AmpD